MSNQDFDDDQEFDPANFISSERKRVMGTAVGDLTADPEKAARSVQLSQATGAPAPVIYGDMDNFEQQHKTALTSSLLTDNKYLRSYIADNPMASKVSADDYAQLDSVSEKMGKLDRPGMLSAMGDAFKEGFDYEGMEKEYARLQNFVDSPWWKSAVDKTGLGGAATAFMGAERAFTGGIYALGAGAGQLYKSLGGNEAMGDRLARDTITGLQMLMSGQAGYGIHPELAKQIDMVQKVRPYVEAGKEPPVGLHPDIDATKIEQAKVDGDNLKDALKESSQSATRERSPDMFADYIRQHTDREIGISPDAIRELYKDKIPESEDGLLGWVPDLAQKLETAEASGLDVQVALPDWLAKVEPEVANQLHDFIRVRENGVSIEEGKTLGAALPEVGKLDYLPEGPMRDGVIAVRESSGTERTLADLAGAEELPYGENITAKIKPKELYTAHEAELEAAVQDELGRIAPKALESQSAHAINLNGEDVSGAHIMYDHRTPIALYSLAHEDPIGIARHEAIHHLRGQGFFSPDEWGTLAYAAIENDWIKKYDINKRYANLSSVGKVEEAVAEAFREWRRKGDKGLPTPEREIFRKMEMVVRAIQRAFARAFGKEKPPTWEELFDRVDEGEIGSREGTKPIVEGAYEPKAMANQGELDVTRMEDKAVFDRAAAIGMTIDQYRRYMDLIESRKLEDVQADLKRVKDLERKRQTKEWKDNRADLRTEVAKQLKERPDVQADEFLRDHKLELGKDISADDLAGYFGYQSGAELVDRVQALRQQREASGLKPEEFTRRLIDAETDRQMERKYGNLGENILQDAKDQVLSETQLDLLHEETVALAEQAGAQLPIPKADLVGQIIQNTKQMEIGALTSDKLLEAAGRAGRETEMALLKGDPAEAFRQKQRQFIAVTMAKEAMRLEKDIGKFEKLAKRMSAREVPAINQEYTNWTHDILMRVGKPVKRSIQDLEGSLSRSEGGSLEDFVNHKEQYGMRELPVAEFLFDGKWSKPFEKLTVDEFNAINDSIKSLIHNGRDEKKVIKAGEEADFDVVRSKMIDQLQTFTEKNYDASGRRWLGPIPPSVAKPLRSYLVSHLQLESVLNRWDRGDPRGVYSKYVARELASAANYEAALEKEFSRGLVALADKADLKAEVPNALFKDPLSTDGNFIRMTRKNLRAILLNVGNESNLSKLARGYKVEPEAVLDWVRMHATPEDVKWAQGIGKLFADIKAKADTMYRGLTGIEAENIPLRSLDLGPHGVVDGWYYPVIYHPVWEGASKKLMGGDALEQNNYIRATTPRGYTKARTSYAAPMALDLDMMPVRMRQMLHDVAMRPSVMQAAKFFYNPELRAAITKHVGVDYREMLIPYLRDVANAANFRSDASFTATKVSEFLRQNVIATLIGLNPGTVLKHGPTAAINSLTEVGPMNFLRAIKGLTSINEATGETNWSFAMKTSEELQRRHRHYNETLGGAQQKVLGEESMRETLIKYASTPVAISDLLSAVPTWMAKYKEEMEGGTTHGESIEMADRAVRRAHGSSAITNRSEIMRGGPLAAWMTSVYGFFNHIMNRQYELMWQAGDTLGMVKEGNYAEAMKQTPKLTAMLFSYVILPALIEEMVTPLPDDHHESWGMKAAKGLAYTVSASWIGVRDLASAMLRSNDPSIGLFTTMGKSAVDVVRDLKKDRPLNKEHAGQLIQHGAVAMGAMTGLVNAQEGKTARFIYDYSTGKAKPKDGWGWMTGLRFGTLKNHSASFDDFTKGKVQK